MVVYGIDGCKQGWVAVSKDLTAGTVRRQLLRTIDNLAARRFSNICAPDRITVYYEHFVGGSTARLPLATGTTSQAPVSLTCASNCTVFDQTALAN